MAFQFVNGTKLLENTLRQNTILQSAMFCYYCPIVKREVMLCKANKSDKILCVGGGCFPCTAILFHQLSGATITVIDNDAHCVSVSQKLIKQLGLENSVIVKLTDGKDVSGADFDIVHIAMQISPKEVVFDQVRSTMRKDTKILVRTPKQHLERGYHAFKSAINHKGFIKQPKFSNIEKTVLYVC